MRGKDESRKVRQEGGYWKSPVRNKDALGQVVANPVVITGKKWVNIEHPTKKVDKEVLAN